MMGARGDDKPDGYANSGVYLQNRYEMQIESPPGKQAEVPYGWKISLTASALFCMDRVPDVNAVLNGEWQSFHFDDTAPKRDGDKYRAAALTVWWNGLKYHDNAPISKANGGVPVGPSKEGLKLQEHGQDVRFRNIWIKERSAE